MNWKELEHHLKQLPKGAIQVRLPCEKNRIAEIEASLGRLPAEVSAMLPHFNGAEFFVDGLPFVALFGLSLPGSAPGFDWFVDRYTSEWRTKMARPKDWVVAMTNYGGLVVVDECGLARIWDTATHTWQDDEAPYEKWLNGVLSEGEKLFLESHQSNGKSS